MHIFALCKIKSVARIPVAMSKRKEKMLPLSSPAQRILPGASKERDSTRPVSLLEPPFTFFPVEMFTTCRWCLLFPTWNTEPGVRTFVISSRAAPRKYENETAEVLLFFQSRLIFVNCFSLCFSALVYSNNVLEIYKVLFVLWFIDQCDNTETLFIPTETINYLVVLRQTRPLTGHLKRYKSDFGVCAWENKCVPPKFLIVPTDCQLKTNIHLPHVSLNEA